MKTKPLSGLNVLELATVLAGPSVGMFFAELGANVTKIEHPGSGGDVTRSWKLHSESESARHSAYFASVNYGKKHLFIDLKDDEGVKHVRQLAAASDIIISNHTEAQSAKFGLDFLTVKATNPTVIYGHITGYGEKNERPAYDVVLQAEAGYMFMNGQAGSEPTKLPIALIDMLAAHQLKEGLLLALWNRQRTGEGALVSASLLDAAVSALSNQATNWLMGGHIATRDGSIHPNISPYGELLTTSDGKQIVLAVGSDAHFQNLCNVLGLGQLASDVRFTTNQHRVVNRKALHDILLAAALNFSSQNLMTAFALKKVPAGLVKNMKEVFEGGNNDHMLLKDTMEDGAIAIRPKQVAFEIR